MLTIERVREHIRQDETYDDALLQIYINAAVQTCEEYTGLALRRRNVKKRVRVYANQIKVPEGAFNIAVAPMDASGCRLDFSRSPDGKRLNFTTSYVPDGYQVDISYDEGPRSGSEQVLHPMIELGLLKFIAHAYENRADQTDTSGQVGRNSSLTGSGAAELWNKVKPVAF